MYKPIGDYIWFYLLVIVMMEALGIYTWRFRKMPGAMAYIVSQACKGAWLLFLFLASRSTELPEKIFWISLQQTMAVLSPYLWFIFVLQLSQQEEKISFAVKYGFLGIIGFLWLTVLSNPWHGLYWREVWLDGQTVMYVFGPVGWLALANSYLLCLISAVLSVRWVISNHGLRCRQALWFTMPALFSWGGHIMGHVPGVSAFVAQPLGFFLSGVLIAWAYYRWQIYSILSLAQDIAARNMIEGLLIIDEQDYVVEINPTAQAMFKNLPINVGARFQDVAAAWPALAKVDGKAGLQTWETIHPEGDIYYQLNIIPLQTTKGYSLGRIILCKDITQQKQVQSKILEQQKALSILAERERLGRELHDGKGQLWSYINMQVEAIRSLLGKKDLVQADLLLKKLAGITQEIHVDIRESITGLQLAATAEQEVWQALAEYLQWFQQNYEIAAELIISNEFAVGLLAPTTEVQLLRIIQEALTNVRKYARAHHVKVIILVDSNFAEVRVEDDGCGFDSSVVAKKKGSFGLKIMQERAVEIGVQFRVQSAPNAGTKIIMQVPLVTGVNEKLGVCRSDGKEKLI